MMSSGRSAAAALPLANFMKFAARLSLSSFEKYSLNCVSVVLLMPLNPSAFNTAVYHAPTGVGLKAPTRVLIAALLKSVNCRVAALKDGARTSTNRVPKTLNGFTPVGAAFCSIADHSRCDGGVIRQAGSIERKDGAILTVTGIVAELEAGGGGIHRAALAAGLSRFQDPTVIGTLGWNL